MKPVGLVGYGRFGRALGSLLTEKGLDYVAYDPEAGIPGPWRASSLEALAHQGEVVVLAVPVPRMRAVLQALRPHLRPTQLVLDVGSVKVRPVEALASVLGRDIPWVGTHPLFGPLSLALAERPLRTVVCPNPLHPEAAGRARALFESLGSEVIEQSPEAHDKNMAHTHALTFFVAKGMVDAGVGLDVPFAPASFKALSRTIELVRSDAGHLFSAIQSENPYAAEARQQLVESLSAIHQELKERPAAEGSPKEAARMAISVPEAPIPPELREVREHIDALDKELLELLARRVQLAKRAARAKADTGQPVLDAAREEALLAERRAWAGQMGLDPEGVDGLFRALLRFSRRTQQQQQQQREQQEATQQ